MSPAFPARRRADEFDRLLRGSDVPASDELRELAGLAAGLSTVATASPRAAFSADLRERLMAAAVTELTPDATAVDRLTVHHAPTAAVARTRRRLTAGVAALAIIGGTAGTALASQNALPGDALYPVKRALESLHSDITVNRASQGDALLADAGDRLSEVHELTRRAQVGAADNAQITATLNTFSQQAQQASAALLQQYRASHDPASLTKLRTFDSSSMTQLSELAAVVPSAAQDALSAAAETLLTIDQSVRQVCGTSCGPALQLPSSLVQSLASSVQHIASSLPRSGAVATGPGPSGNATKGPAATQSESVAPATKVPGDEPSGAPTKAATGGGANQLTQQHASALASALTGVVSGAASGVGAVVGGLGNAVGGVLGGLLGGASQKP